MKRWETCLSRAPDTRRTFLRPGSRRALLCLAAASVEEPQQPPSSTTSGRRVRIRRIPSTSPAGSVGPDPRSNGGRVDIKLFPANQLGSDTDLAVAGRSGGVDFFNLSSSILSTLSAAAGILNTGFAFPDYDTVWKAMDGEVGGYVRTQIQKVGLMAPFKLYDNGFRQITSSTRPINVRPTSRASRSASRRRRY